jgi:hypothetical protein
MAPIRLTGHEALNLVLALCRPNHGRFPSTLFELGFEAVGIEREVYIDRDSGVESAVADLILGSSSSRAIWCIEFKSASVDDRQARVYERILPADIFAVGLNPANVKQAELVVDISYLTGSATFNALLEDMGRATVDLPVCVVHESSLRLSHGFVKCSQLLSILQNGIALPDRDEWPMSIIPFTCDSNRSEMASVIAASLVSLLLSQERFGLNDLCASAIGWWNLLGTKEQRSYQDQVRKILKSARANELRKFLDKDTSSPIWISLKYDQLQRSQSTITELESEANGLISRLQRTESDELEQAQLL